MLVVTSLLYVRESAVYAAIYRIFPLPSKHLQYTQVNKSTYYKSKAKELTAKLAKVIRDLR